jgi:hypothetical protein
MSTRDSEASEELEREVLRNEIQAAIAAGRDLSPEMDTHLADAALDRYRSERSARQRTLAAQRAQTAADRRASRDVLARTAVAVAAIAAVAAVVIVALLAHPFGPGVGDHFFFPFPLFFLLPLLFAGRWRRNRGGYGYSRGYPSQPRPGTRWERQSDDPSASRHEFD